MKNVAKADVRGGGIKHQNEVAEGLKGKGEDQGYLKVFKRNNLG